MSSTLKIPELVAATLSYLTDSKSLFACALVNRLWAEEATALLWSSPQGPPITALDALVPFPARLQYYASKVTALDFSYPDEQTHPRLISVKFPKLKTVTLDGTDDNKPAVIMQYLQPQLERFLFFGGPIDDAFLAELSARCPVIKYVLIDNHREMITADGFLTFLDSTPTITELDVMYGMDSVMSNAVLSHLFIRPGLLRLQFRRPLFRNLITSLEESIGDRHIFPDLQRLHCVAEENAIRSLLSSGCLFQLRVLELGLLDKPRKLFVSLARHCPNLEHLEVDFEQSSSVSPPDIILLAEKCKQLRRLSLYPSLETPLDTTDNNTECVTDTDVDRLARLLPRLQNLTLEVKSSISVAALKSLGTHCRELVDVSFSQSVKLEDLDEEPGVLFPLLVDLNIGAVGGDMPSINKAIATLERHAPKLRRYSSSNGEMGEIEKAIWRHFRAT